MHNPTRIRQSMCVIPCALLLVTLAEACGSLQAPEGSPSSIDEGTADVTVDELQATRCRDPRTGLEDGLYLFEEMTQTLRRSSALAVRLPFTAVTTCAAAREFVRAYQTLSVYQPGFDTESPPKASRMTFVEEPSEEPSKERVSEIPTTTSRALTSDAKRDNNGAAWPFPTNPVVKITTYTTWPDKRVVKFQDCSAVFLGKNWLLTAAHCLAPININNANTNGYSYVQISWAATEASMMASSHQQAFGAYQISHPKYSRLS